MPIYKVITEMFEYLFFTNESHTCTILSNNTMIIISQPEGHYLHNQVPPYKYAIVPILADNPPLPMYSQVDPYPALLAFPISDIVIVLYLFMHVLYSAVRVYQ